MVAPTLNDYEYQYKDTGFLLNGSTALPFFDVQKVTGLDIPTMSPNIDDIDGQHGGTVYGLYTPPRTIIVSGNLYANPATVEQTIDTIIGNYMPTDVNDKFYFKHPGVSQRYCLSKPIGFNCDVETLRRVGSAQAQIQLACEDPRKYVDNANQNMTAGTNYTPSNPGNVNTYPIFTVTGAFTTITFTDNTQARSVVLTTTRVAGDVTVVDMKQRSVTINGVQSSGVVTTANWWSIPPGSTDTVKYTVTGGPPTSVVMATKQGWM